MSKSTVEFITIKVKRRADSRTFSTMLLKLNMQICTLTFGPRDGYADGWAQAVATARALLNSMVIGVTRKLLEAAAGWCGLSCSG